MEVSRFFLVKTCEDPPLHHHHHPAPPPPSAPRPPPPPPQPPKRLFVPARQVSKIVRFRQLHTHTQAGGKSEAPGTDCLIVPTAFGLCYLCLVCVTCVWFVLLVFGLCYLLVFGLCYLCLVCVTCVWFVLLVFGETQHRAVVTPSYTALTIPSTFFFHT